MCLGSPRFLLGVKNSPSIGCCSVLGVFPRDSTSTRNLTGVVARGESSIDLLARKTNDSLLSNICARDRGQVPIDLVAVGGSLLDVSNRNALTGSLRFSMCFPGRGQFVLCCETAQDLLVSIRRASTLQRQNTRQPPPLPSQTVRSQREIQHNNRQTASQTRHSNQI